MNGPSAVSPPLVASQAQSGPETAFEVWQMPPLDRDRRLLAGIAAGLAREIGIDPIYVRVLFVVLTVAGGVGVPAYLAIGLAMYWRTRHSTPYQPIAKGRSVRARHLGFGLLALGLTMLAMLVGPAVYPAVVLPVSLIGTATALALDQGYLDAVGDADVSVTRRAPVRLVAGAGLLTFGIVGAIAMNLGLGEAILGSAVAGLVAAGVGLMFAPVVRRSADELLAERRRRIRSDERAQLAAHLHDSVLQTLALIESRSTDPGVVSLARSQERELRTWLFEDGGSSASLGFGSELEAVMAEVESRYDVPVEVVVVGDMARADVNLGEAMVSILGASREAATNAARHSKSSRIDVYAEVGESQIEVFVRDQGSGFDMDDVGADRAGIRDSITARLERLGGSATVSSTPGVGTEVEMLMPLNTASWAGRTPEVGDRG